MNSLTQPRAAKSGLLIDESPLVLLPTLAVIIGDRRAIALQQIHYWLDLNQKAESKSGKPFHFRDGRWWTYNTYQQWHETCFPFWTPRLIRKIFTELEDLGVVLSAQFDQGKGNPVKWYTIDYEALDRLEQEHRDLVTQNVDGLTESDTGLSESVASIYTETSNTDYQSKTSKSMDKRLASQNAARPFPEKSGEAKQGGEGQNHSPVKPEVQKSGTPAKGSENQRSAAAPRQKWTPAEGIDVDRQGWLKLPATNSATPADKTRLSRAKANAVRWMQYWLCEQGIREIELDVDEDGFEVVRHLNDTETLDDAFGRGGSLPLRLLRTLAYEQGLVSQEEFNSTLEEAFWDSWHDMAIAA
jgi:hypothetical protein